jgi:hypothetical protein
MDNLYDYGLPMSYNYYFFKITNIFHKCISILTLCQLIVVASVMSREAQIIMYDDAIQMVPTRAQSKRRLGGYQCIKLIPFSRGYLFYGFKYRPI